MADCFFQSAMKYLSFVVFILLHYIFSYILKGTSVPFDSINTFVLFVIIFIHQSYVIIFLYFFIIYYYYRHTTTVYSIMFVSIASTVDYYLFLIIINILLRYVLRYDVANTFLRYDDY